MQAYAREIDEHKRTLLLVNKADLLPFSVRLVSTLSSLCCGQSILQVFNPLNFHCLALPAGRNGQNTFALMKFSSCSGQLKLLLLLLKGKILVTNG